MTTISNWQQLSEYGIVILTGEACGLAYRYLCDLTEQGKKIVEKCLGQKFAGTVEHLRSHGVTYTLSASRRRTRSTPSASRSSGRR